MRSNINHGFISQEVLKTINDNNLDFGAITNYAEGDLEYLKLSYSEFIAPIVKSIQEIDNKIQDISINNNIDSSGNLIINKITPFNNTLNISDGKSDIIIFDTSGNINTTGTYNINGVNILDSKQDNINANNKISTSFICDGTISDNEFKCLNGITYNIQNYINNNTYFYATINNNNFNIDTDNDISYIYPLLLSNCNITNINFNNFNILTDNYNNIISILPYVHGNYQININFNFNIISLNNPNNIISYQNILCKLKITNDNFANNSSNILLFNNSNINIDSNSIYPILLCNCKYSEVINLNTTNNILFNFFTNLSLFSGKYSYDNITINIKKII